MRAVALMACHNRRELTLRALRSLFNQDFECDLQVALVDDGSVDGTTEAVEQAFGSVTVIPGDGSLFWAAAMARAERAALEMEPDVLLWLNDDVELSPGALSCLSETSLVTNPPSVVAGSVRDESTGAITYGGLTVSRWHPLRTTLVEPSDQPRRVDTFNGNVLWVPIEASRAVGPIDGAFAHAYADNDYGLRLRAAGYPTMLAPQSVGTCGRETSSRGPLPEGQSLRARWRALNSPRGLPLRSQVRFFRRHGPRLVWPAYAVAPYAHEMRASFSATPRRPRGHEHSGE